MNSIETLLEAAEYIARRERGQWNRIHSRLLCVYQCLLWFRLINTIILCVCCGWSADFWIIICLLQKWTLSMDTLRDLCDTLTISDQFRKRQKRKPPLREIGEQWHGFFFVLTGALHLSIELKLITWPSQ